MLPLNEEQRSLAADKLSDMANVAAGALVFGQALAERPFSVLLAVAGVVIWLFVSWCSLALAGGARR
jgi:hypothetical protein